MSSQQTTSATSTEATAETRRPYTSVWNDLNQVEFSQGFLQAGPYRTRYLHAGDESKPVLLFLHGITGHGEAYVRNLAAHAEHFSVWAIDFIGHGYSTKPDHPLEIPHYVDQVTAVLDTLGAERAHFSGESLGGWVAARYAADHPDRVDRVVLNTMGGTMANPQVMERLYTLSMEAAKDPSWERVKARLAWLMADPTMVTDDLIRTRQAIFEQPDWLKACEMNMALQDPETRQRNMISDDDLRAIQAEALVVWTTKDPSGPVDEGRRIASLIPNGYLEVIEEAGHWPQYEKPEVFNRIHLDHLLGRVSAAGHPSNAPNAEGHEKAAS
ncbi:alpha/beta fold hydrolase [Nocardioides zhouii]|uniref:alpha/beta fold hydrolase n=1 Tax=Nocardioides zhouii TaxID=1168729 RepID=UPI0013EDA95C|nr:alpha/beta hydrolase [Nocardioides zhouii]